MPKCDFNKVAKFIKITIGHGCSPVNLRHIFRTSFYKNISGRLLLPILRIARQRILKCFQQEQIEVSKTS